VGEVSGGGGMEEWTGFWGHDGRSVSGKGEGKESCRRGELVGSRGRWRGGLRYGRDGEGGIEMR
jgi:hypothetical protein